MEAAARPIDDKLRFSFRVFISGGFALAHTAACPRFYDGKITQHKSTFKSSVKHGTHNSCIQIACKSDTLILSNASHNNAAPYLRSAYATDAPQSASPSLYRRPVPIQPGSHAGVLWDAMVSDWHGIVTFSYSRGRLCICCFKFPLANAAGTYQSGGD